MAKRIPQKVSLKPEVIEELHEIINGVIMERDNKISELESKVDWLVGQISELHIRLEQKGEERKEEIPKIEKEEKPKEDPRSCGGRKSAKRSPNKKLEFEWKNEKGHICEYVKPRSGKCMGNAYYFCSELGQWWCSQCSKLHRKE